MDFGRRSDRLRPVAVHERGPLLPGWRDVSVQVTCCKSCRRHSRMCPGHGSRSCLGQIVYGHAFFDVTGPEHSDAELPAVIGHLSITIGHMSAICRPCTGYVLNMYGPRYVRKPT